MYDAMPTVISKAVPKIVLTASDTLVCLRNLASLSFSSLCLCSIRDLCCMFNMSDEKTHIDVYETIQDMLKAYIEQYVGIPYEFPSYHQAIREPYDYYQVTHPKLS